MILFKDYSSEDNFNYSIQLAFIVFDISVFFILFRINAYYGKFFDSSKRKSFTLPNRLSWIIQESPCVFVTIYYIIQLIQDKSTVDDQRRISVLVIIPFLAHYIHRAFLFPFVIKASKKNPIELTILAFIFCFFNALIQNRSIFLFSTYQPRHFYSISYIIGGCTMFIGSFINLFHDYYMISLTREKEGYILPEGYLYDYISCPNYFGELVEWLGFALMTSTLSAWIFFISSFANLFPRAIKYHNWYKVKFKETFPSNRLAIFPYVI